MTSYTAKIHHRAIALQGAISTNEETINILLRAIEERDKLLQEYYKFFGVGTKEAERIGRVLEIP